MTSSSLDRRLRVFVDLLRRFGPARSTAIAARWLVRREYLVLVRDLAAPLPAVPHQQELRWTDLSEADFPQLWELNPLLRADDIRRRLREGQRCLLCWLGDTLVHYRWESILPTYLPYLGLIFRPGPGDFLADEIFTRPAFRGRGIYSAGVMAALHRARQLGCQRSITLVVWWDAPVLRVTQQKTGRTVAGTVGCWTVGRWRRYFSTGAVRLDDRGGLSLAPPATS